MNYFYLVDQYYIPKYYAAETYAIAEQMARNDYPNTPH